MYRVLSVDDDPHFLNATRLYLEEFGFKIDIANSAAEALGLLATHVYHTIISDYQMPDMDGISLLKEIRKIDTITPFIFFTGTDTNEIIIEALENGAEFYLLKGI
ncbi:MAG TPA: response regulator, partial [Methanospirillum sp.]|nr:response regulator [Methanospirillum sp.]